MPTIFHQLSKTARRIVGTLAAAIGPWAVATPMLFVASSDAAEPASYFRADQGRSREDERSLPSDLSKAGSLVWRTPVAPGHSTPCVHGDALYVTTFEDKQLATVALDRATGKVRWKQVAPAERLEPFHATGSPASASVACDGQRVYSFFGSYGLLCYDVTGKLVWSKPLGPFQDEFGSSSSPVLVDGKLLLNEDHDLNSFLLCVDAATGAPLWQTRRDGFTRSYSTPVVLDLGGTKQVVVAGALQLVGYDLESGKQLWSLDGLARIVNTTPVYDNGMLYVATWSPGADSDARVGMEPWEKAVKQWDKNNDGQLTREEVDNKEVLDRFYRIDLNQDKGLDRAEWEKYARVFELARNSVMAVRLTKENPTSPEIVWKYEKGIPYVPSPLVYRGVLYLVKDGGIVTSLEATTGKVLKQARVRDASNYLASPVAGDGKLYVLGERGVLSVLNAGGKWDVAFAHELGERSVASPMLGDGRLYVRTEKAVYCFQ